VRCIYGVFGREITKYTVIYGAYVRFWSTPYIYDAVNGGAYHQLFNGWLREGRARHYIGCLIERRQGNILAA